MGMKLRTGQHAEPKLWKREQARDISSLVEVVVRDRGRAFSLSTNIYLKGPTLQRANKVIRSLVVMGRRQPL